MEAADAPPLPEQFSEQEAKTIRARGYLTAPECGRCHQEQLEQWQTTRHAVALKTLVDQHRAVRECLVCHSEANRRGLPYDPKGADGQGVDCAACHGAGLQHASTQGERDTIVARPSETVCRRCHTAERDAHFAFETRVRTVIH
jgi:predicted CxxxxCH...CXXCH cytochrome family protein